MVVYDGHLYLDFGIVNYEIRSQVLQGVADVFRGRVYGVSHQVWKLVFNHRKIDASRISAVAPVKR